ncbi:MAG: Ig-like domain-containing protein [Desulfobacula sp.]|jgi:hypothetical protein
MAQKIKKQLFRILPVSVAVMMILVLVMGVYQLVLIQIALAALPNGSISATTLLMNGTQTKAINPITITDSGGEIKLGTDIWILIPSSGGNINKVKWDTTVDVVDNITGSGSSHMNGGISYSFYDGHSFEDILILDVTTDFTAGDSIIIDSTIEPDPAIITTGASSASAKLLYSVDGGVNWSEDAHTTATLTIDATLPTIDVTAPVDNAFINTSAPAVSYTLSDNVTSENLSSGQIKFVSGAYEHICTLQSAALTQATHTFTLANTSEICNGWTNLLPEESSLVYAVTFSATDSVGNVATDVVINTVTYDTDPPTLDISAPAFGDWINSPTVTYTISESLGSGSISFAGTSGDGNTYTCTLGGAYLTANQTNLLLNNTTCGSGWEPAPLVDAAVYTVTFSGTDLAGNAGTPDFNTTVHYDITKPTITVTYPANNQYMKTLQVSYTLEDTSGQNLSAGKISFVGTSGPDSPSTHDCNLISSALTRGSHPGQVFSGVDSICNAVFTPLVSGTLYTLYFEATDKAGNTQNITPITSMTFDNIAPIHAITAPVTGARIKTPTVSYTNNETLFSGTFNFIGTGNPLEDPLLGQTHTCELRGTALDIHNPVANTITLANDLNICTADFVPLVNNEVYNITFDGQDYSANPAIQQSVSNVTFDNVGPTLSISIPGTNAFINTQTVTYNANEPLSSGTIAFVGTSGDGSTHTCTLLGGDLSADDHTITLTSCSGWVDLVTNAKYTVDFNGIDLALNSGAQAEKTNVTFDITDPIVTLSAPANDAYIKEQQVSYNLTEQLTSGTIKFTGNVGSGDETIHTCALTSGDLGPGDHSLTLVHGSGPCSAWENLFSGAVYTVTFEDGLDQAGNPAAIKTNTNVTFDDTLPILTIKAPTTGTYVSVAKVSYNTNEDLKSGTIAFVWTGGTADPNSHSCLFKNAGELTAGDHDNLVLDSSVCTSWIDTDLLISGAIYKVTFNGSDLASNLASATEQTGIMIDLTPPVVSSAKTGDENITPNGQIDRLTVVYDTPVIDTDYNAVAVAGHTITGGSGSETSTLVYFLSESGTPDTDSTPALTWTPANATDLAGNPLSTPGPLFNNAADGAKPVLITVSTPGSELPDYRNLFDAPVSMIDIQFSENVTVSYIDNNWGFVSGHSLTGLDVKGCTTCTDTATVTLSAGDSVLTGAFQNGAGTEPQIQFTAGGGGSIRDLAATPNYADNFSATLFDHAGPNIISVTTTKPAGSYNTGDVIDITLNFSEDVTTIQSPNDLTVKLNNPVTKILTIDDWNLTNTYPDDYVNKKDINYTVGALGSGEDSNNLTVWRVEHVVGDGIKDKFSNSFFGPYYVLGANLGGIIIDTTVPTANFTAATDDVGSVTGVLASGDRTDDTALVLSGTNEIGSTVAVYNGLVLLGAATVSGIGWTYTATIADATTYQFNVKETDAAGNTSAPTANFTVIGDTTAPTPNITAATDDVPPVIGVLTSGARTDDTVIVLSGTNETDSTVAVYNGLVLLGPATVVGTGWTYAATIADATTYQFNVKETDTIGNTSVPSANYMIIGDMTAPTANLTAVTDNVGTVQGALISGQTTDDTALVLSGTNEIGSTVAVYNGLVLLGAATVTGTGWTYTATIADVTTYQFNVKESDSAGNASAPTADFTVIGDMTAPTANFTAATDDVLPVTGILASGARTDDTALVLSGTNETDSTVAVYNGLVLLGAATVAGTGWTYTATIADATTYQFNVKETDSTGNTSAPTANYTIIGDMIAPTPNITSATDDVAPVTGVLASGARTDDTALVLSGTNETGSTVAVYNGLVLLGAATVAGTGWTYTATIADATTYQFNVKETDSAGNTSVPSANFTIIGDMTAPTANFTAATDDVGSVTGVLASGDKTDDTALVLSGTNETGSTVAVYNGLVLLGAATVAGTGWTYTATIADATTYQFNVKETDSTGSVSAPTADFTVIGDMTGPTVTINQALTQSDPTTSATINFTVIFSEPTTDFIAGDVNLSASSIVGITPSVTGSDTTYNVAVTGMSGAGGTVIASIDAGVATDAAGNPNTASTSIDPDNIVTWSPNTLPDGSFTSAIQKLDGSGNVDIAIAVSDADFNDTKAKIEYETDSDGACDGPWLVAKLIGPATASVGTAPDINNGNIYQVGSVTRIITTSLNNVAFDWDSENDLPEAISTQTQCLQLTVNDDTANQNPLDYITLTLDNVPPTADNVDIAWSLYKFGDTDPTATVTFSEDISTAPTISIAPDGAGQSVDNCSDADAKTWCFTYALPTVDLTTETISISLAQDATGNTMALNDSYTFDVDTVKPTVDIVSSEGATYLNGDLNPVIQVDFSEDISTAPTISVAPEGGAQIVGDCGDFDATTWCFTYTLLSVDLTTETITISGAQDASLNTMDPDATHTFDVDTILPTGTVEITEDPINIVNNIQTVTVIYGEEMSGAPTIAFTAGSLVINGVGTWDTDKKVWTATFTDTALETFPVVTASSTGATDLAGNVEVPSAPSAAFDIDRVAPTANFTDATDNVGSVTGILTSGDTTNDSALDLRGTKEANSTVEVFNGIASLDVFSAIGTDWTYTATIADAIAYVFNVKETDSAGNISLPTADFTVIGDMIAPTVILSDDHADAFVKDADTVIITATFTEANQIDETTIPPTITIGTVVTNGAMFKIDNKTWTYTWDVPAANNGVVPVSITARDQAGNASALATGKTSYTIDNILPTVLTFSPATGATGVATTAPVVVTFSEPVDTTSLVYTLTSSSGVTWSAGDTVATIAHSAFTNSNIYTVTVTSIKDKAGNTILAPASSSFTIVAASTPPPGGGGGGGGGGTQPTSCSFSINYGAESTNSVQVMLNFTPDNTATQMLLSNDINLLANAIWMDYSQFKDWRILDSTFGTKTVYMKVKNNSGTISQLCNDSIEYVAVDNSLLPSGVNIGDLVKRSDMSTVYFIDNDYKRHSFPNPDVYFSWFADFSKIKTITNEALASIPLGPNVTVRPGTNLIKIQSVPNVYAVEPGGIIRWVETEEIARKLWGDKWYERVLDISSGFFVDYQEGSSLDKSDHPTASLVQWAVDNKVYYIENGIRRFVTTPVFMNNQYQNRFVYRQLSPDFFYVNGSDYPGLDIATLMLLR